MAVETTVQVVMPAMGDSVSEGTILEWRKQEGDQVSEDETIVEISTDKVDAEVPAPASGTIVKLHAAEGDTVEVGQLLAEISTNGDAPAAPAATNGGAPPPPPPPPPTATLRRRLRPRPRSSTSSRRPVASRSPRARSSSGP